MRHPYGVGFFDIFSGEDADSCQSCGALSGEALACSFGAQSVSTSLPRGDTCAVEHSGGAPAHRTIGRYMPTSPVVTLQLHLPHPVSPRDNHGTVL